MASKQSTSPTTTQSLGALLKSSPAYFKPKHLWKAIAAGSKGLGDRRQRIQPAQVLAHEIWLPPNTWQHHLAKVQAEVNTLKRLQAETAEELDAMLPAILDRAFKGKI